MHRALQLALLGLAFTGLAGCKVPFLKGNTAPSGQVAATYDGDEITTRQIALELGAFSTADPKIRKLADTAALENILSRRILAKTAMADGVDKSPDYAMLKQRADENLLVELLEKKLAAAVPVPTQAEAASFVADHPFMFAQRKIYVVDQLRLERLSDPNVLERLRPLTTMADVEAELTKDHVAYDKGVGTIDTLGADPNIADQLTKLTPNQIFIVPSKNGQLLVNQVKDVQTVPVTGDQATIFAQKALQQRRTQDAVKRELSAIVSKGLANVSYNKDYAPVKTPAQPPEGPPKSSVQ